jgi:hypothetical protein
MPWQTWPVAAQGSGCAPGTQLPASGPPPVDEPPVELLVPLPPVVDPVVPVVPPVVVEVPALVLPPLELDVEDPVEPELAPPVETPVVPMRPKGGVLEQATVRIAIGRRRARTGRLEL